MTAGVLLGADGKPVMRNDGSRVGFRFADAARLAWELAAASEDETADGTERRALAPRDSGFNRDWDPQRPKSTLADMTKWTRLLAYHYVQTTEPEEAVRRAVSMIFGKPVTLDEQGTKLWVPTQYDAEAVKSVANALLHQAMGPSSDANQRPLDVRVTPFGAYLRGRSMHAASGRTGNAGGQRPNSEANFDPPEIDDDSIIMEIDSVADGIQRVANIWHEFQGGGTFFANPGAKASGAIGGYNPRVDHEPVHFHLRLKDGREIRYLADMFEVYPRDKNKDTREHDKIIRRLSPEAREHLTKATHEMFETGKLSPESRAKARGQFSKSANKAAKQYRVPE